MHPHCRNFTSFIAEASDTQLITQLLGNPESYDEEASEWFLEVNKLSRWLDESQVTGSAEDVAEAVDAVVRDSGHAPEDISLLGVLDWRAVDWLGTQVNLTRVESSGGWPGAPSIRKHEDPSQTWYFIAMDDSTLVAHCWSLTPEQRKLAAEMRRLGLL